MLATGAEKQTRYTIINSTGLHSVFEYGEGWGEAFRTFHAHVDSTSIRVALHVIYWYQQPQLSGQLPETVIVFQLAYLALVATLACCARRALGVLFASPPSK